MHVNGWLSELKQVIQCAQIKGRNFYYKIKYQNMKRCILICLITLSINLFSQNTVLPINLVTYKVGKISSNKPIDTASINKEAQKRYEESIAAMELIECQLYYTKEKSIYSIVDKMDADNSIAYKLATIRFKGLFYKDIVAKEKIKQTTIGNYNVSLPFDEYNWNITNETKTISGYKCFKATCDYNELSRQGTYMTRHAETWFAPEIAVPFGPKGYDGLPGLVLEVLFGGNSYIQATKIEFDIKKPKLKIERPEKGEYISFEEYEKIQKGWIAKLPH